LLIILSLFHGTFEWILVLASQAFYQRHFGLRNLIRVNARNPYALLVDMQHNLNGLGVLFVKHILQDLHNELLGSIIVIVQENFVEGRFFLLFLGLCNQLAIEFGFPPAHKMTP
jgi:hypothetical protein